ncbi:MAG TPA: hypothetical protein VIA62_14700 [Thermoanaerobaculia bacterium]|jgi:bifunctional DNA-binding transcriptional regulator/antitoxin component of YhaV-PrlF toxin-antitoxin module|nr:hypothetical protein [Thermoanaerobaculia bacterium]
MAILPGEVRWALGLNPGDLLFTEWDELSHEQLKFLSYAGELRSVVESVSRAWPWVEKLLAMPMAAVAPGGGLMLPKVGAILLGDRPGVRQRLQAGVQAGNRWFTVKPADERPVSEEIFLEACYTLPVEPGFRVTLPADVLWALSLKEGDVLVSKGCLATAEIRTLARSLERSPRGKGLAGCRLSELEPGGKVSLPDAVRVPALSQPDARIHLKVILSPYDESLYLDSRALA